ncbi:MAG TPA: hypothetical protein VE954_21230 [Oligoflexus sp.]|uniref:hypothetical protein n=1 Tax=Oligoflexus sp. TaxID=1971216 RepID=UPI002D547416|nr:hypothetical protein [Oligoflexus sp.]HYX35628.1 hypothetical protein [Oligoflexus sp.]
MDKWQENLDRALGEAPAAPADEFAQILRRTRMEQPGASLPARGQLWPTLLCAGSLAFAVLVSVFIKPETESSETTSSSLSMLSIEATTPFDESLERLEDLADQIQ